ncbi:Uncharacterised protein [Enterobacter hormaechei]|nr:Uncharacterised protein [Enterobacter hormaechei]
MQNTAFPNNISPQRTKGRYTRYAGASFFSCALFVLRIYFRLIVSQHNPSRKGKWHACCALAGQNDAGKANRQAIRRRKSHTDGEKTMTISLHYPGQAPLTPQRRPAYPRWTRQAPQKRNFLKPERIFIRPLPTTSLQRWKPVLNPGPARGSVYPACLDCHLITPPAWPTVA